MTPDAAVTFLSNMDLFWLITALAGGAFGAMIGANNAFGFTGVAILFGLAVLAGTGSTSILDYIALGPILGPHTAFAGGVAGAAYAARRGLLPLGGKDIATPLAGLSRPDVLMVGALFGGLGYIVQRLISLTPWFGSHTDSVALSVFLTAVLARILFSRRRVLSVPSRPTADAAWLPWQESPGQILAISGFVSVLAAGISTMVGTYISPMDRGTAEYAQVLDNAHILPFGISAVCIFFVSAGLRFPVTHHQTVTAGLAGVLFLDITGNGILALLAGAVFGILAGFLAELMARVFYNKGDTHIDPSATAIWVMNTLVVSVASLLRG